MNWTKLAGNRGLKARMENAPLSHAYLLSGPAGSGKHTLANILAQAMVCEKGTGCGLCPHCRKAAEGIHPDIITIEGEKAGAIKVDEVRALRADAYIRPNEAARKVYILPRAQTMNPSAQNALLKLLEDGPAYAAFLLLTENAGAILQTIRSRCVEEKLAPLTLDEVTAALHARFPDKDHAAIAQAAGRCDGLLGPAIAELSGDDAGDLAWRRSVELGKILAARRELPLLQFAISLEKADRGELTALYDEMQRLLHDALCPPALAAALPEWREAAAALAAAVSRGSLVKLTEVFAQARAACDFNIGSGHSAGWTAARCWEAL